MATVQGVYLALFNRPADPAGLAYWNGVTKNGQDLGAMLKELPALPEYTSRFTNMGHEQIVNSIYQALFGRDPEPAGLAHFVALFDNKTQTVSTIAVNILDGAQGTDKALIDAKLAASDVFVAQMDLPNEQNAYTSATVQIAKDYLAGVTENSPGTAALADAAIAKMLQQGGGEPNGGGGNINNAPVFSSGGEASIDEHEPVDAIVYAAKATDDTSGVKYSLAGSDADAFNINELTGEVRLKVSADRETKDIYDIGVRAQDSTGLSTVKNVTVSVNDVVEIATEGDDVIHWTSEWGLLVVGLGGNDDMQGGTGNDQIEGGAGNDTLVGGLGKDILIGGADDDIIKLAGGGKDTVKFENSAPNNGFDTITGFTAGNVVEGDLLSFAPFAGGSLVTAMENYGYVFSTVDDFQFSMAGRVGLLDLDNADAAKIAAEFGAGQAFTLAVGSKAVILTSGGDQNVQAWYVDNAAGNAVTASEVKLVGSITLADGQTLGTFHSSNFA